MRQVFSGVRKDLAVALAAAVGGVALSACSSGGGTDYRPAPRYVQPQQTCGATQPAPSYPQPAPAPAPRPQAGCGARCG